MLHVNISLSYVLFYYEGCLVILTGCNVLSFFYDTGFIKWLDLLLGLSKLDHVLRVHCFIILFDGYINHFFNFLFWIFFLLNLWLLLVIIAFRDHWLSLQTCTHIFRLLHAILNLILLDWGRILCILDNLLLRLLILNF